MHMLQNNMNLPGTRPQSFGLTRRDLFGTPYSQVGPLNVDSLRQQAYKISFNVRI